MIRSGYSWGMHWRTCHCWIWPPLRTRQPHEDHGLYLGGGRLSQPKNRAFPPYSHQYANRKGQYTKSLPLKMSLSAGAGSRQLITFRDYFGQNRKAVVVDELLFRRWGEYFDCGKGNQSEEPIKDIVVRLKFLNKSRRRFRLMGRYTCLSQMRKIPNMTPIKRDENQHPF